MKNVTGYRILIVDDHASNRTYLREALALFFKHTLFDEAEDGVEAIEKVRHAMSLNYHPPYDLIFMDYMMPVMNGEFASLQIQELISTSGEVDNTMQIITWSSARITPFRGTAIALPKPTSEEHINFLLAELNLL